VGAVDETPYAFEDMAVCRSCGAELPPVARFCASCGASVSAAAGDERKVVTVLFADLVGFTGRAELLDPEDVRALQDSYWQHVRAEIERHGGTVEKFIGDAVFALFGAPVAHEDDPERAVRAALAIRGWATDQEKIQVRVGVTTGEALVRLGADPLAGEGMASGDVVNIAARLQAAAPPNEILVGERTYRATRDVIEYREGVRVEAKGKTDPVPVWVPLDARSRFGVDLFQHTRTQLIGRGRELELVLSTLNRARAERSPQLLTLVGVPGIGKSRLVYELMRAIADDPTAMVTWRQGRSLPYGDGVSFWALAEMVKAEAGIFEGDGEDDAYAKLGRAVRTVVADATEAEWIERHLRPLTGLDTNRDVSDERRGEAFAAWRRFFEALADRRPTVLVFEDLHWADDDLIDFVDTLVDWVQAVPLLVVATARPELLERRPSWGGGKANAATLSLAPLSEDDTSQLIRGLLEEPLPADTEQALVSHAAGNPLYAEQYVRMWGEHGHAGRLPLPETVHGIIAARLDAVSEAEKTLLQNGSIFGKVFWDDAVIAVDGVEVEAVNERLRLLERKEFVQRARRSSVEGATEYAFRHVLVRDVAYGQIPRAARAEKHERAAAWTESLGRHEDHAEMLAHHYVNALQLGSAAGRRTDHLTARACNVLMQAGDRAFALNASAQAAGYYALALELLRDEDPRRPRLLFRRAHALFAKASPDRDEALARARDALLTAGDRDGAAEANALLAEVWWYRGQRDRCTHHLDEALELVADSPVSQAKARVLSQTARYQMLAGQFASSIHLSGEALTMADELGLDEFRAQALITLGAARCQSGDGAGAADIERGLTIALDTNHLHAAARGYMNLSDVSDDSRRSEELLSSAEEIFRSLGDRESARYATITRAAHLFESGDWDGALRLADEFIAECEAGNPHYSEAWARLVRAAIRLARDEVDVVVEDMQRAVDFARDAKDPQTIHGALGFAAHAYVELGLVEEARAFADELLGALERNPAALSFDFVFASPELGCAQTVLELFRDKRSASRSDDAAISFLEGRIREAAALFDELGAPSSAAHARLRGAAALLAQDRESDAAAMLEKARAFYETVHARRYVREAELLLSSIAPAAAHGRTALPRRAH
jgi:class 3 adenylate cyclase/tetratricopeptide (TPR) repeat protein